MAAMALAFVVPIGAGSGLWRAIPAGATPAQRVAGGLPTTTAPLPPPKAWIAVDADTGNVIEAGNDHTALPPASLTKIITALAVVQALPPTVTVPVSARAAAQPAHKISMKQGEVWTLKDSLYALLLSSANDAAVALAERAGRTVEGFQRMFTATADSLGMADHPLLADPAGLDGPAGVDGGNLVSARDLGIAARALLADPTLGPIVADPVYYFVGPDGTHHRLLNHNFHFLQTYPGAIGMKTGFTNRAGPCLITAARRNGRTMLAVVLNAPNELAFSEGLLDKGFATPVAHESAVDQLPALPASERQSTASGAAAKASADDGVGRATGARRTPKAGADQHTSLISDVTRLGGGWPFWSVVVLLAAVGTLRLRAVVRDSARRRRTRHRHWEKAL
jgi:D-alanyl-D-alanine carboxypeptidase (penicillin-binding protein 5/6)